jgi:hypothetical protein
MFETCSISYSSKLQRDARMHPTYATTVTIDVGYGRLNSFSNIRTSRSRLSKVRGTWGPRSVSCSSQRSLQQVFIDEVPHGTSKVIEAPLEADMLNQCCQPRFVTVLKLVHVFICYRFEIVQPDIHRTEIII